MRRTTLLVLAVILIVSASAFGQGPEDDKPSKLMWPVRIGCGCGCLFICLLAGYHINKAVFSEFARGKKYGMTFEEELDAIPKKRQILFKGEKVPDWKISGREKATKAALKFIACTDNWFEKKYIADVADEAFRLVKEAMESRSLRGIEKRVTPECLEELQTEIKRLRREQEVHVFGRVEVTDIDLVQFEAPVGKENHTFTAIISAKSKDFFEDDETGEVLRGDKKTYAYQEIWSFRRSKERWLVELLRPSSDIDSVLEAKNVMAAIDLEEFAKDANPEFLKEFVAR
jgi:hypothetical protein